MHISSVTSQISRGKGQPQWYAQYLIAQYKRQQVLRICLTEGFDIHNTILSEISDKLGQVPDSHDADQFATIHYRQ